jgi:NADH-quinone oxidoreductase subunit H
MQTNLQIALQALVVGFIITLAVVSGFAYTTLLERKLLAKFQHRVGPNRAGYIPIPRRGKKELRLLKGFLQPLADALKLFFKEDATPGSVDRAVYNLAPMLAVMTAIMILAVIPWAGEMTIFGVEFTPYFAIAPGLNTAVLFILAITSIGVYGVMLGGWASNSKYAVLGGIRASAQMISYELTMALALIPAIMLANSMDMGVIVSAQSKVWFAFVQPVAAVIFFIAILAELERSPFDLLEAEQELASGFNVEYGGMRFGMFFMAEYMKMVTFSAIFAVIFLGGYRGPFVDDYPALGFVYTLAKIIFGLFMMIWIRATLPRLRYDRLMHFGWKRLLPVALATVIITAVVIVLAEEDVWTPIFDSILSALPF